MSDRSPEDRSVPEDGDEAQALTQEEENALIWAAYWRIREISASLLERLAKRVRSITLPRAAAGTPEAR